MKSQMQIAFPFVWCNRGATAIESMENRDKMDNFFVKHGLYEQKSTYIIAWTTVNIPNLVPFESGKIRHVLLRTDRVTSPVMPRVAG